METKKVKFNGVDIFIIAMLIAVIAAGAYLLSGRSQGGAVSGEKNVNVTAVIEITGVEKNFADKIKTGDIAMLGEKDKMETVVEKVEVNPAKTTGYDILGGNVYMSEIPGQVDVKVTVKALGTEDNNSIKISGIAIKVGQKQLVAAKGWAGNGYVIGLDTKETE